MNFPDIGFTYEYAKLFEHTAFGGELWWFDEYRFYKRPILGTPYFDITSPYGYAGPLPRAYAPNIPKFCKWNDVIAEFARLHPFIENHKSLEPECVHQAGEVYYIDLTQPLQFDKGCKSAIKKARNEFIVDGNYNAYLFDELYNRTMKRNHAGIEYYFGITFFNQLGQLNGVKMFTAFADKRYAAAIIILKYGDYAHYFLAGSDENYRHLNPSNLLLSEAINWAKEQGCKIFNLGGGKDESHASFKRSFTKLSKPFYVYKKIHNAEVYEKLSAGIKTDWFPAYRSVK